MENNMKRNATYKTGEIVIVTQGDYSDYCIVDVVKILKAFDIREYLLTHPDTKKSEVRTSKNNTRYNIDTHQHTKLPDYTFQWRRFDSLDACLAHLIKDGYIEPVQYREAHEGYSVYIKLVL